MKKTALVLILICLMASGVVYVQPIKAQYERNVTIEADGTVLPSTAPIEHNGNIYTVTADIQASIHLYRNNTILNGAGHTVQIIGGPPSSYIEETYSWQVTPIADITICNFTVNNGYIGFDLLINSTIANNTIDGSNYSGIGIGFGEGPCKECIISGNNITNCLYGITVIGSNNIVTGNTITEAGTAMSASYGSNNMYVGNYIEGATNAAIQLNGCFNDTFARNEIVNNSIGVGCINIMDQGTNGNLIYCNDFIDNTENVVNTVILAPIATNSWDNGTVGNYWSDYLVKYHNASEIDSSGIGDTPYVIDAQNKDRYPLMEPFNEFYVLTSTPPKISLLSPLQETYNKSIVSLVFSVDKSVNWTGYSLDGGKNVTISGNDTIAGISNGVHSVTVYANDTYGNMGASETVTFTVAKPEPFPTTLVAAASVASVAVVGLALLVYFKKRRAKSGG